MSTAALVEPEQPEPKVAGVRPRVGFLGVGWIGRNRMEAIRRANLVEVAAIADPADDLKRRAGEIAPEAALLDNFDELLEVGLNGVVVATPSALHAAQAAA